MTLQNDVACRAARITVYVKNGGRLETAQQMANHGRKLLHDAVEDIGGVDADFAAGGEAAVFSSSSERRARPSRSAVTSSPQAVSSSFAISFSLSIRNVLPDWNPPNRFMRRIAVRPPVRSIPPAMAPNDG